MNEFKVCLAQVHDEIFCVTKPEDSDEVGATVRAGVESFRDRVPLIGMDWHQRVKNWGEK